MGDAGPATPVPGLDGDGIAHIDLGLQNEPAVREVKILVTGFGVGHFLSFGSMLSAVPARSCQSF